MKNIIKDDIRKAHLDVIDKRIKQGKSILIIGKLGSGKTELLKQIRPKKKAIAYPESLGPLHYLLGSILKRLDYNYTPKKTKIMEYLEIICSIKNAVIIIDEADDIRQEIYPYIKRIMNAGIPVIYAGLPALKTRLKEKHVDILCRVKILNLPPVNVEEFKKILPQFEPDALEVVYGASSGNMHYFNDICDDCLDKMSELKLEKVNMDIVGMFI